MANRKGSSRSRKDRGALAASLGLLADGIDRTPEQQLWYAVLIEGLRDLQDGIHWPTEDFEIVCENAACDPDVVLRMFRKLEEIA